MRARSRKPERVRTKCTLARPKSSWARPVTGMTDLGVANIIAGGEVSTTLGGRSGEVRKARSSGRALGVPRRSRRVAASRPDWVAVQVKAAVWAPGRVAG